MSVQVHSPAELATLLVSVIAGAAGGDEARWREAIGPVTKLPFVTNVRSNWRVTPTGSKAELGVIRRAIEIVRAVHPYVAAEQLSRTGARRADQETNDGRER